MFLLSLFFFDIYNFNSKLFELKKKSHFIIALLNKFWKIYFLHNNFIVLDVKLNSNKFYIKKSVELIFNIKVTKINTLIKKKNNKKKALIRFFINNDI